MRLARLVALLGILSTAPFHGGCVCQYKAAEREVRLARPVDPGHVQAVLRSTPEVQDLSAARPVGTKRLFYIIPVRRDVYHAFRLDDQLYGHVRHKEGGREMELQAYTRNHRPDEQVRRRARDFLDRLEMRLLDSRTQ